MATYNGELYIEEQINSILTQTYQDYTLYIQDDGSKDKTVEIIKSYSLAHENVVYVDNGLTKQGAGQNFMTLLNCVESDYYMFADQDDVWLPFKIELSLGQMKNIEQKIGGGQKTCQ